MEKMTPFYQTLFSVRSGRTFNNNRKKVERKLQKVYLHFGSYEVCIQFDCVFNLFLCHTTPHISQTHAAIQWAVKTPNSFPVKVLRSCNMNEVSGIQKAKKERNKRVENTIKWNRVGTIQKPNKWKGNL